MKTWKAAVCFVAVWLLACSGKVDKINDYWFGNYDILITYGPLDEFSAMFIDYNVAVYQDSCAFSGMGYRTFFTDLCKAVENKNALHLIYMRTVDGDGFTDHSNMDTLATLIQEGQRYYIKSSIIADTDWVYNKKLLLNKEK
jgi:hypothetical protein